jgi:hypothetical protein
VTHPFLSDPWIAAARQIHDEVRGQAPPIEHPVRINLVVRDVPFGEGTIAAHADTSGGEIVLELGHLDDADVTLTLDYATARAMLVDQDPQAGMQAFMTGKIAVDGDLAKVLALQGQLAQQGPEAEAAAARIKAITA